MIKSPRTIQIISDISDISYNEMWAVMRGVAKNMTSQHVEFAPIAPVKEFSITHGAFLTRLLIKSYISPAVLFTNVAPHKTFKSDVIGKIKDKDIIFMGSNNGIFDWIARDYELDYLAEITVKKPYIVDGKIIYLPGHDTPENYDEIYETQTAHKTFGAHVIYGAIAVGLALGVDYRKFGEDRNKDFIVPLEVKKGEVVHIDNYGNAKVFGFTSCPENSELEISLNGNIVTHAQYVTGRMMSYTTNTFVIYPSTSLPDLFDLALVRGNAAQRLGLRVGDILSYRVL